MRRCLCMPTRDRLRLIRTPCHANSLPRGASKRDGIRRGRYRETACRRTAPSSLAATTAKCCRRKCCPRGFVLELLDSVAWPV